MMFLSGIWSAEQEYHSLPTRKIHVFWLLRLPDNNIFIIFVYESIYEKKSKGFLISWILWYWPILSKKHPWPSNVNLDLKFIFNIWPSEEALTNTVNKYIYHNVAFAPLLRSKTSYMDKLNKRFGFIDIVIK